jgi:hypothetical protein
MKIIQKNPNSNDQEKRQEHHYSNQRAKKIE